MFQMSDSWVESKVKEINLYEKNKLSGLESWLYLERELRDWEARRHSLEMWVVGNFEMMTRRPSGCHLSLAIHLMVTWSGA